LFELGQQVACRDDHCLQNLRFSGSCRSSSISLHRRIAVSVVLIALANSATVSFV
jgi:hypothetical protein